MKTRGLLLVASTVVLCLLLLTLQTRSQSSVAADLLAHLTTPAQTTLARTGHLALGLWSTYREWKDVRAENIRLRDEIQRLHVSALRLDETADENRRLRQLLSLQQQLPVATMSSEIIAREWGGWVRSLTINRGRQDGIGKLTAVITSVGLVGRVAEVRRETSIVQVLIDPASTVGAHVVTTRTQGIVEGESRGTMRFKYMARDGAGLQPGDLVVTSGAGRLFPRGLPIGRIRAIDDRGSALFHYAALIPAVDFSRVEEVLLVLESGSGGDVTAFFREGDR
ncbi:MAG: rod shape-determining protein MreC [Candidatus Rokuibacteriota bacterium]